MHEKHVVTALIAEDEPLLATALKAELASAWPALQVVATVADGASAVAQALALQPDVLFFDIKITEYCKSRYNLYPYYAC